MTHVPKCLQQLHLLEVLDLSGNNLSVLRELRTLSSLDNLHELSALGNKVCELPHYREYTVYTLRSLSSLDTSQVRDAERQASVSRFAEKDANYEQLAESLRQSTVLANTSQTQQLATNIQRNEKLRVTQQLLEQRTSEWAYANERMTQLEQELAFHKIDHSDWSTNTNVAATVAATPPTELDAASTSLLALLSPLFDWELGRVIRQGGQGGESGESGESGGEDNGDRADVRGVRGVRGVRECWVSPTSSPTRHMRTEKFEDVSQMGLMDAVVDAEEMQSGGALGSASIYSMAASESCRVKDLERTAHTGKF